jgi:hypothetical protein
MGGLRFNETSVGQRAMEMVQRGEITVVSIGYQISKWPLLLKKSKMPRAQDIEYRSLTNFGSILRGIEPNGARPTSYSTSSAIARSGLSEANGERFPMGRWITNHGPWTQRNARSFIESKISRTSAGREALQVFIPDAD